MDYIVVYFAELKFIYLDNYILPYNNDRNVAANKILHIHIVIFSFEQKSFEFVLNFRALSQTSFYHTLIKIYGRIYLF